MEFSSGEGGFSSSPNRQILRQNSDSAGKETRCNPNLRSGSGRLRRHGTQLELGREIGRDPQLGDKTSIV